MILGVIGFICRILLGYDAVYASMWALKFRRQILRPSGCNNQKIRPTVCFIISVKTSCLIWHLGFHGRCYSYDTRSVLCYTL